MKLKRVHSVYAVVLMGCLAPFCPALASDDEATQQSQAQQQAKGTGIVTGHVYCADTKAPARFATVTLQPVSTLGVKPSAQLDNSELPVSLRIGLEGAFTFPAVPPGDYLVLAWLPGYVSPLAQLTTNELHEETDPAAIKQKLTRFLGRLTVYRGQTSSIEISLERGVELSGTVTYDDGIPAAGMIMKLFRQQEGKGPWLEVLLNNSPTGSKLVRTDDRGHFRIAGVPARKYVLSATFPAQYFDGEGVMTGSGMSVLDRSTFGWLEIYSGNTLRVKDARPMEFVAGERRSDVDIVVPLSKLRHLSGIVIAQGDGHPLKIGVLYLLYADDMSLAQRAHIGIRRRRQNIHLQFRYRR
jgi:hypothetical protein